MSKYKYLITGKHGLIGSSLVRLFQEESLPFLSISRRFESFGLRKNTDFSKNIILRP